MQIELAKHTSDHHCIRLFTSLLRPVHIARLEKLHPRLEEAVSLCNLRSYTITFLKFARSLDVLATLNSALSHADGLGSTRIMKLNLQGSDDMHSKI